MERVFESANSSNVVNIGRINPADNKNSRLPEAAKPWIMQVQDKFPNALDQSLLNRLGEANCERAIRIRDKAEPVVEEPVRFKPVSEFHDSGLGTSIPTETNYATSTYSAASHTSFVSSLAGEERGKHRVPKTPVEIGLGKPFECDICGKTVAHIKNRVQWKYGPELSYHLDLSDCFQAPCICRFAAVYMHL